MSEKRDAYFAKMKARLDRWNGRIDKLEKKAGRLGTEARAEVQNQIDGLKAKQTEVKEKIDGLRHAGEGAWKDLKTGVDSSWKALAEAGHSAIASFKQSDQSEKPSAK
jgi:predicted  nucleic acid-binding Zn-ribbon protein